MDPNLPNTTIQSVPPITPNKRLNFLPVIIVGIVMLLLGLGGGYLLFANKSQIKQVTTQTSPPETQQANPTSSVFPTTTVASPTPTPDPTANWKLFTSQKYGYGIKYPSSLVATEFFTPFYLVTFKRINAVPGELSVFDLLASPDTFVAKDPAAYDWLSADMVNSFIAMVPNTTKQVATSIFTKLPDTVVAGEPAAVITVKSTLENITHQKRVFIKNNGNMYMFVNYTDDPSQQSDFNNFLSTFKFTQ